MPDISPPISILFVNVGEDATTPVHQLFLPPLKEGDHSSFCVGFSIPADIPLPSGVPTFIGKGSFLSFYSAFAKAVKSRRFDIIQLHSTHAAFVYAAYRILHPLTCLGPGVLTIHTSYPNLRIHHILLLLGSLPWLSRVVYCGSAARASFPGWIRVLIGQRGRTIINGCALDTIARVRINQAFNQQNDFTIFSACRLIPLKNIDGLVKAFAMSGIPDTARLIIYGEGTHRCVIEDSARRLGIADRLSLPGVQSRSAVYKAMATSSVFVSLSRIEGMPKSVIEAMACEKPVILSNILPHREIAEGIEHLVALVPPDNISAAAGAIRRLHNMSADERAQIGKRCRAHIEAKFTSKRMRNEYRKLYDELRVPA